MSKPENLGVIVFLGVLILCLCTFTFWLGLKLWQRDGQFQRQQREAEKAALVLREEREKLERLLRTVHDTEKGKE